MIRVLLIFFLLGYTHIIIAQHSHGNEANETPLIKKSAPHNGEVVDAGKYKLEILTNPMQIEEKLVIFLLKRNNKEVELQNATASVVLKYRNGKTDSTTMHLRDNRFHVDTIDLTQPVSLFFRIDIGKKRINSFYYYGGVLKQKN